MLKLHFDCTKRNMEECLQGLTGGYINKVNDI